MEKPNMTNGGAVSNLHGSETGNSYANEPMASNSKSKPKILITGGAGYVGTVLTEHLLNEGYRVTVLDSLIYNQNSLLAFCHNKNFEFVYGDCRDEALLRRVVPGFDFILPLAAIVGAPASEKHAQTTISVNYEAIVLLNKIRDKARQKIIFPTTNSGYGTTTGEVFCTEESPLNPVSLYGQTKVDAEKELLASPNVITLRFATLFGFSPRMRTDLLVNDFVYRAIRDKSIVLFEKDFKRNFLHVRDAARCFLHCIENFEKMKNNAYNVGLPDANISKEQLALKIKEFIPGLYIHNAEIGSDPDKRNYIVSNDKIGATGFTFRYSLEDGIRELIKGYSILRDNHYKNV
jgi:nucleoside-diphosphate-sugar epimerase